MAFPVFASGDVLNASDMNAVGLWLVKTQTIGSAVTSVAVTSAFSSDYENYRITVSGGVAASGQGLGLQFGSTTTGYYDFLVYGLYTSTALTGLNTNNGSSFANVGTASTDSLHMVCDVVAPNLAKATVCTWNSARPVTNGLQYTGGGFVNNTTQYTGFTLTVGGGATMTGGTIRVYGYRN